MTDTSSTESPDVGRILDLGYRWADAELRGDAQTLATLLTDDFVGVGPLGFELDKRAWLQRHSAGGIVHKSLTLDDVKVHVFDGAALVTAAQTSRGSYAGAPISGRQRITQVLVRANGGWAIDWLRLSAKAEV